MRRLINLHDGVIFLPILPRCSSFTLRLNPDVFIRNSIPPKYTVYQSYFHSPKLYARREIFEPLKSTKITSFADADMDISISTKNISRLAARNATTLHVIAGHYLRFTPA